jgi:Protein  of unknown function (DUF3018)
MAKVRERVREHRERLRAEGLRPVQHWVPDLRDPRVREAIQAEVRAGRDHASEREIEPFLDAALEDIEGWE